MATQSLGARHPPPADDAVPAPKLGRKSSSSSSRACIERVNEVDDSASALPLTVVGNEQSMSPTTLLRSHGVLPLTSDDGNQILQVGEFAERDVEIILDSGCCEHVMDAEHAPGYRVQPSLGSLRGQNFFVGNGEPIANEGQVNLRFGFAGDNGETQNLASVFQIAEVTNPLMSVSSICDKGFTCVFDSKEGRVLDQEGATVCTFDRSGGLYSKTVRLQPPEPFGRPA